MNSAQTRMLVRFDKELPKLQAFTKKLGDLVRDLLAAERISVHSVTSRVKSRESLQDKILRPEKNYTSLDDITDLCGIRITTYFREDVNKIAFLLEKEFEVDWAHSVDKRQGSDPDRFGYQSIHHVLTISRPRIRLAEYRLFLGLKAEVQTRSILQHAWAEIEHDLGYKARIEVPRAVRRRFSRLVGLLELADDEFQAIRADLSKYEAELPTRIEAEPHAIPVDLTSLNAYLLTNTTVKRIDRRIAKRKKLRVSSKNSFAKVTLSRLSFLRVLNLGALNELLSIHEEEAVFFAETMIPSPDPQKQGPMIPAGISVFHLCYALVTRPKNPVEVERFVQEIGLGAMTHRLLEIREKLDSSIMGTKMRS